jgi:uncharacterized protein
MNPLDVTLPFGFGVVSSLHCTQMCGPIVLSYSMAGRGSALSHVYYNLGRIATYSLLGAIAGAAGSAVGLLGRLAGFERTAMLIAGGLMLLAGLVMSGWLPKSSLVRIERVGVSRIFSGVITKLMTSPKPQSKLGLGLLMGLLPCGLLYAALLKAVSTADPWAGAATMALFGAGTALSLLAIGLFSSAIGARLGRWSNVLATASVLLMGAFLLWKGIKTPPTMGPSCHGHS